MTRLLGNAAARSAFIEAASGEAMHHAWLFAGPSGVGKAGFARIAAARLLAHAADASVALTDDPLPAQNRTAALIAAGSHPDYRELRRLPKDADKPDGEVARSIRIEQVRSLQALFATKPSLSPRRVVVIDAIDDLERPAANALLKNLEEPPAGTLFLLVSHAPGRLLPTIRSRCRVLRFAPLEPAEMAQALRDAMPDADDAERAALAAGAGGSVGQALGFAGLDMAGLDTELAAIADGGDADNMRRARLARMLGAKTAQPRYLAFLARVPSFIAARARAREGADLRAALDAYAAAQELAASAPGLSLDPAATVFEMGGIVARLAGR